MSLVCECGRRCSGRQGYREHAQRCELAVLAGTVYEQAKADGLHPHQAELAARDAVARRRAELRAGVGV